MTERGHNVTAEDRALLVQARAGDERAFGRLLDHHRRGLELYCCLMLGDPDSAKRVMAETVLSAWRERDLDEPPMTARMWLYRVASRMCEAGDHQR